MDLSYTVLGCIGEGAHGVVLKALQKKTSQVVAMKRIQLKRIEDGLPKAAIREIKALQLASHEYILKLVDYFAEGHSLVLVCDYLPSNLWELLQNDELTLTDAQKKTYMTMLLGGVAYLHDIGIMHRDLKPANLLINEKGVLKIADFGLCRVIDRNTDSKVRKCYSHQVASRWYRAPELLFGSRSYDESVDLWAVGCIMGELLENAPIFPGENDIDQLCTVLRVLGTPNETVWPGVTSLPDYNKITFNETPGIAFSQLFTNCPEKALDLLKAFLQYSGTKRISAKNALDHPYFFMPPLPCSLDDLPKPSKIKGKIFPDWEWEDGPTSNPSNTTVLSSRISPI